MAIVSINTLSEFVQEIAEKIRSKNISAFVVFLSGNLGSGKTTFMQGLARELGIMETVQSPTFVLMKNYVIDWNGFSKLVHIDAYRLEDPQEFAALKPEAFLSDPKNIVCIEWAEHIADVLPKPDLVLKFSSEGMGEGEREIEIQK